TFTAPLLILTGRWAFWPQRAASPALPQAETVDRWSGFLQPQAMSGLWHKVADVLLRRPATVWIGCVGLMLPFAALALANYGRWDYGLVHALPAATPSVRGTQSLAAHFSPGMTGPASVLVENAAV